MKQILLFILFLSVSFSFFLTAQTPAFPGAEGHGRYTTGGRGGTVYYVTNLSDDKNDTGSLRYAVNKTGPRTIIFAVSGTIRLTSELKIANGNVTIAGQSAPGDGICLADYPVFVNANNVIIRYIRCRMGDEKINNSDGADALGGRKQKNVILDHCSVSWCTDECASFYENENMTMQWCLISESLRLSKHSKGAHGYGAIWGGMKASFHHNLLAHHDSRVPRLGPGANSTPTNELVDMRNNVFYNYNGNGCYGAEAMHVNIVNNYYKLGPGNTYSKDKRGRIITIDKKIDNSFPVLQDVWGTFYIDGNIIDGGGDSYTKNATNDNWTYGVYNQFNAKYGTISQTTKDTIRLAQPLETDVITTHTAEIAFEQVLNYAGCSFKRDTLDIRIVEEAKTNTATYKGKSTENSGSYPRPGIIDSQNDLKPADAGDDWSAWPELVSLPAPVDTNKDGIPDGWLEEKFPEKKSTDLNDEGYTYLEVYLNSIVEEITIKQNERDINTGISQIKANPDLTNIEFNSYSNILSISSQGTISSVEIFNLNGILVNKKSCNNKDCSLNLSQLTKGVYIIRVIDTENSTVSIKKIIKFI